MKIDKHLKFSEKYRIQQCEKTEVDKHMKFVKNIEFEKNH